MARGKVHSTRRPRFRISSALPGRLSRDPARDVKPPLKAAGSLRGAFGRGEEDGRLFFGRKETSFQFSSIQG